MKEYIENDFATTQDWIDNKIEIIDLSSKEILQCVKQRWAQLNETWEPKIDEIKRQDEFIKKLKQWNDFSKYGGQYLNPNFRLSDYFFKANPEFLNY